MSRGTLATALAALAALAVVVAAACGADGGGPAEESDADTTTDEQPSAATPDSETVTLVAYESFPTGPEGAIAAAFDDFTIDTGVEVEVLIAGDTGTMLSKAALTAGNPEGDVMWGVDNSYLSRAVDAGVFEPYEAARLDDIAPEFTELVPGHEATPVDFGDVCVNYDIGALDDAGVAPPTSLADLTLPDYRGMLAVQNPATSSPGLAFLLATVTEFGDDGWETYWQELMANDVVVVDGWTQAYYEEFSWWGGDRPLVVSYGSSPPFEVMFAEEPLDTAPTGVVEATCFRQIEFVGVLAGTDAPGSARLLVDFLGSERFQREVATNLFVFPVNDAVELEAEFVEWATIPTEPLTMESARIDENRADWIDRWTALATG